MAEQRSTADPLSDVSQLVGGEYLKAKDLENGPQTFSIAHVAFETFEARGDKKAEQKVVLTLDGDPPRKLPLNHTNLQTLMDTLGKNAHGWVGRTFDAYFDASVRDPGGKKTGGLRVRVRELPSMAKPNGSRTAAEADPIPF